MGTYHRPIEIADALTALSAGPLEILAGGTDYYPSRVGKPLIEDVLDISALADLRGIVERDDHWLIGALSTWRDLMMTELPPCFDGLKTAAREIGGLQVQNRGTICGNFCNASPAADGMPPLLTLDARVQLASLSGARSLRLEDFVLANRRTARRSDELVTNLIIPKPPLGTASTFQKLGARKYLVISIAMVAVTISPDSDSRVAEAHVAIGACSPVARRLPELEAALIGQPCDANLGAVVAAAHLEDLNPIDDVRGTGSYRRDAALTLVKRALSAIGVDMRVRS
ncbi:MAG: xanthine dehydrogenase family protein subunit M [Alphaproteobacteria bacterium]|nr:xanthine dehydrogenase family protein subunit M [Alphaproteobacteria bacterium]